jgi:alkylation response protein AidB-like acyl-CoA dehydrogenase
LKVNTMDFAIPDRIESELRRFGDFFDEFCQPRLSTWYRRNAIERSYFAQMGQQDWLSHRWHVDGFKPHKGLRQTLILAHIAHRSPGLAVASLIQSELGLTALARFGSEELKRRYGPAAGRGDRLICIGNTENQAGSDAAAITMQARPVGGGWRLTGAKAYVSNGEISDFAVVTAITEPAAARNRRSSMFLVDLKAEGVRRKALSKQVWRPADLTRLRFDHVYVPATHLLGDPGRGLQQTLAVFTHSRIPIAGLALGTARGAFELAMRHARQRSVFGKRLIDLQAKGFEAARLYAQIEAAHLALLKACWAMDGGRDYRMASSLAKYLTVEAAKDVSRWSADLFGAAGVLADHPIHKFPLDAWAVSLAEGTQDIQKLVLFRELIKHYG